MDEGSNEIVKGQKRRGGRIGAAVVQQAKEEWLSKNKCNEEGAAILTDQRVRVQALGWCTQYSGEEGGMYFMESTNGMMHGTRGESRRVDDGGTITSCSVKYLVRWRASGWGESQENVWGT